MFYFIKMFFWVFLGLFVVSVLFMSVSSVLKARAGSSTSSFWLMFFIIVVVCPLYVYIKPERKSDPVSEVYATTNVQPNPAVKARREWLEEMERENGRMDKYAEEKDKELRAKSVKVIINPDSVGGMAEYRYYLKTGKIVSCLKGFNGDVLVFDCSNYSFN
ncbi:hypothetical protein D9M69_525210 [compost metagenome]